MKRFDTITLAREAAENGVLTAGEEILVWVGEGHLRVCTVGHKTARSGYPPPLDLGRFPTKADLAAMPVDAA